MLCCDVHMHVTIRYLNIIRTHWAAFSSFEDAMCLLAVWSGQVCSPLTRIAIRGIQNFFHLTRW